MHIPRVRQTERKTHSQCARAENRRKHKLDVNVITCLSVGEEIRFRTPYLQLWAFQMYLE